MSAIFPNGTIFSLATVYASAKVISDISNANPGVASATAHGYTDGDIVEVASAWPLLNQRIARVDAQVTDAFSLEGIDTSNASRFADGEGAGSARKITTWVPLSQVTNSASSGGEQQFAQWVYVEDGIQRQRPTFKNAKSLQLTLDYDPDLSWYAALITADEQGTPRAIRAALPNGNFIYYNMYVGFDGEPTINVNQNMACVATFSHVSKFIRYAA
jgi:hypothetical protein